VVSGTQLTTTISVPAAAATGNKKISLYDPYSSGNGYYGRGSCPACLSVS